MTPTAPTCLGPGCRNPITDASPTSEWCSYGCWQSWRTDTVSTDSSRPDGVRAPKGVHVLGNWTTSGKQATSDAAVAQAAGLGWLDPRAPEVAP